MDYSYHSYLSPKLPIFWSQRSISIFTLEITFLFTNFYIDLEVLLKHKTRITTYISNKALKYTKHEINTYPFN